MLTKKQEYFFNLLIKYYQDNNSYPTLNDILILTNNKYYNSIYNFIEKLEKNNYLKYDKIGKRITFLNNKLITNDYLLIPYIDEFKYLKINNEPYISYRVKNNNLKKMGININDILIIDNNKTYLNNKFVLVLDDEKYKIYKYYKNNGFQILENDKNKIFIENTNIIIGKVIYIIKKC